MAAEDEFLDIERAFWTGGPEAYRDHADARCLVVFPGMAQTMEREAIAATAEKGRWRDVSIEPKGLARLSDDVAVIAYECRATRHDGQAHHALVSSAYVKRPEGWKLAFHQQTPLD